MTWRTVMIAQLALLVVMPNAGLAARRPKRVEVTNFPATSEPSLAPTKPSQLVTIRSSRATTCGSSPWLPLDQQVNQDGTLSPFTFFNASALRASTAAYGSLIAKPSSAILAAGDTTSASRSLPCSFRASA